MKISLENIFKVLSVSAFVSVFTLFMVSGVTEGEHGIALVPFAFLLFLMILLKPKGSIALFILLAPFHFVIKELFTSPVVSLWQEMFVFVLGIVWLLRVLMNKVDLSRSGAAGWAVAAYLIWGIFEIFNSIHLIPGIAGFRYMFAFVPLYFITATMVTKREDIVLFLKMAVLSAGIIAFVGVLQTLLLAFRIIPLGEGIHFTAKYMNYSLVRMGMPFMRAVSFLPGPNQLGNYMLVLILLILPFVHCGLPKSTKWRSALRLLMYLSGLALLLSMSRSSIMAVLVGVVAFGLFKRIGRFIAALSVTGLLLLLLLPNALSPMVMSVIDGSDPYYEVTLKAHGIFDLMWESPLIGQGFAATTSTAMTLGITDKGSAPVGAADIYWLETGIQIGLVGIALQSIMLAAFLYISYVLAKRKDADDLYRALGMAFFIITASLLFTTIHTSPWTYIPISSLYYILAGMVAWAYHETGKKKEQLNA